MGPKAKKVYLAIATAMMASSSLFLSACQDELAYLKDETRYDCVGTFDSGDEFRARYIVNRKSNTVLESISGSKKPGNRLIAQYIRKGQISASRQKMVGPIKMTNQVTITPSSKPIGFNKYVGARGAGADLYGECKLVKLDRKKVLAGRREYQAFEKQKVQWFKTCQRELRRGLKDPSSYSYISHHAFGGRNGSKKYVDIKYRAKNSFGATTLGKYNCVL
ncbi:hypothetical protein OAK65_02645 [Synechococcus sp. AH-551-N17]|nr:hypothetical protein [Synechococcus sp. AH-551-N17]